MKITVIGENFYQIEQFQKFFRWWVKYHKEKLMISLDCCPLSLFMLYYHLKYDDKHHIRYLLSKYMPTYYQTNQMTKFLLKNFSRIRKGNIVLFSSYTMVTDINEILDEYESIQKEKNNMNNLDNIDLALLQNCEMINSYLKSYKFEGKDNWMIYNDYQRQSSIVMSKFSQAISREGYHLLIYTNFINAYYNDLILDNTVIKYKSLVSYWLDRFSMEMIYLVGKQGEYLDFISNNNIKINYKPKHFVYQNKYLSYPNKTQNTLVLDFLEFSRIDPADKINMKLVYEPKLQIEPVTV
jgi:hypothetical protein